MPLRGSRVYNASVTDTDTDTLLEVDNRRRVTLRIGRHSRYLAHEEPDGSLVLVPAVVIPEHEQRLLARPDLLEQFEANRQDPSRLVRRTRKRD